MGTVTVIRPAPGMPADALGRWFDDQLEEMARIGGTDAYCGNFNSNQGLEFVRVPAGVVYTEEQARAILEKKAYKRGPVLAIPVGDFSKVFPATAADKSWVTRLEETKKSREYFDWNILDRGQKAKSKTKKCPKCESSVNVHMMEKPHLAEIAKVLATGNSSYSAYANLFVDRGVVSQTLFRGLTACPVCSHELLKTDTDKKAEKSLEVRVLELSKKVQEAKSAFEKQNEGKKKPFWLVYGECGE